MKKYLLFGLSLFLLWSAQAQERTVTGTIKDAETGDPVPGANVVEKGTTNGTITDFNGQYKLSVGDNATLVVSFVGYKTTEVAVGSRSIVDVSFELDVTALAEVVVIGYGQIEKSDATGAVAAVSAKDFNGGIISSPEQLIAGKTAGVQITSTSGAPGDGVQLRIRGTSSIRSNNNPLFVVDGVPLAGGTQPASADVGYGTKSDVNPLNFINPSDIESISILKDASATAIYGSRGANGVVIITTKGGKGKGIFELTSNVSISSPRSSYDLLDKDEFLAAVTQFGGDAAAQDAGSDTDWQDYVTRTSVSHKQNLSYSKGFKTGSIRTSLGYEDQQGVVENSYMKRFTGRVNGSKSFMDDAMHLTVSSTYSNVQREDPPISGNAGFQGDLLGAAYSANPTWPTDPDFVSGGQRSPANMLEYFQSTGHTNRLLTNLSLDYKIVDGLVAKATYGLDLSRAETVTLIQAGAINAGNGVTGVGLGQINGNDNTNNLFEFTLNHTKKYGNVAVEFVAGYSVQSFHNKWYWTVGNGFTDPNSFSSMESQIRDSYKAADDAASDFYDIYNNWGVGDVLNGGTQASGGFVSGIKADTLDRSYFARPGEVTLDRIYANFYDQTDFLQSYFARGNFTISNKYIITATIRADGSSKFGDANKYGIFPSGAVAWKIHEEGFAPDIFSTLKFRAGYGVVGNQDGLSYGEFVRRDQFRDANFNDARDQIVVPGSDQVGSNNRKLRWESTTQASFGLDFGILSEKISGSFDVYNKQTTDLLLRRIAAQPSLVTQIFDNLDATVENKGWELSLNYNIYDSKDASISLSGNVSHNKNLLKDFNGQLEAGQIYGQGLSGAYAQILAGGHPLFSYYLREFGGFDSSGQPIGDNQTFVNKTALPTWNSGLSINAEYKNFSLQTYMYGQFGHYIYNNTANGFFTAGAINNARNVTKDVVTSGEAGSAEAAVSTRFLEKGDFIRMQNVILTYRVPVADGGFLNSLSFNVTGQNLFVITDYNGLDPEVSSNPANFQLLSGLPTAGIDYAAYPKPRVFTVGLNASF